MPDPYRLTLAVTHADGSETRWGPDELDARDVPSGLTFTTTSPGGFSDLACELLRRIDVAQPDQQPFDAVTVYGPGNEVVWEGRFAQFPRQTGDGYTVVPGAEGWAAHLRDNKAFREIYVDRDLSRWGDISVQRKISLAGGYRQAPASITPDATTGQPSLQCGAVGSWVATAKPLMDAEYDAAGLPIGSVYFAWKANSNVNTADANWALLVRLGTTDLYTTQDNTGTLLPSTTTGTLTATTATKVFALVDASYAAAVSGIDNINYDFFWTCLAVYGTHGLTKQGTASATAAQGFYASDIVADAVSRAAPLATYTTGSTGSIQPTSIVLEQMAFTDPTTAEDIIKRCNAVHLWDWGFEDHRSFYFRQPSADRLTWTVRLDDGAHLKDDGPAAQDLINGVVVVYTSPSGQRRLAGPTSATGMHVTDATLQDTSTDNAATAHGIVKKWDTLELSQPATDAFAVAVGAVYLTERSTPQHRGEAVITGLAQHPTRGLRPSWAIRAGDYLQFVDVNDDSIGEPRRIIRTDYDHDQRRNTLALDSSPYTLESLLALLDAQLLNV